MADRIESEAEKEKEAEYERKSKPKNKTENKTENGSEDKMKNKGENRTGEFIARRRKERGMTQREMADRLGVTNKAVSKWETGVSQTKGY